ncbi:MAG TPA: rod shape-determining protein MreC [Vicinamibacterales bacterium]|nr:rod shape-determining protein MreC [Vicinamibacterales bacterium]
MPVLDIRQRTGWLFLAVIVGHIILISAQVNSSRGVPLLEDVTFALFAEVQRVTTGAVTGVQTTWQNYFALQEIREDNQRLTSEVERLRVSLQQERAVAAQTATLQRLLDLRSQTPLSTTGAEIIGGSASPDFRTVTLDKGTSEGLKPDMAVIAPAGVVGRVIMPTWHAAKVQLLIDRNAAAGALTERSRAQGIVVGTGGGRLRMDYVSSSADIKVGDRVVTSGIDGIYPKGFAIGQIESIQRGPDSPVLVIRPAVDFSSLEDVLVVLSPPTPVSVSTDQADTAVAPPNPPPPASPRAPVRAPAGRATPVPPPTPDEAAPEPSDAAAATGDEAR